MDTKPLAFVIEDNEDQSLVFSAALARAGYQAESVLDGHTAKKRLQEVVPAIVILDLHIPGISGNLLLSQIRNDPRLANVIVMLATADAALAAGLQSQVDVVLLKPISFSQIMMISKRYLKKATGNLTEDPTTMIE